MTLKYIIQFYTSEPKAPEIYMSTSQEEMTKLFERIRELTQSKAKFIIITADKCLVDWS